MTCNLRVRISFCRCLSFPRWHVGCRLQNSGFLLPLMANLACVLHSWCPHVFPMIRPQLQRSLFLSLPLSSVSVACLGGGRVAETGEGKQQTANTTGRGAARTRSRPNFAETQRAEELCKPKQELLHVFRDVHYSRARMIWLATRARNDETD